MKPLDIVELNNEINEFVLAREWDKFHTLKNLVMALSVECSELVEIFQWLTDDESESFARDQTKKEKIEDEVADIFIYLLRFISISNIDLEKAVRSKLDKNSQKYPVKLSKGNSKKYSEF